MFFFISLGGVMRAILEGINSLGQLTLVCVIIGAMIAMIVAPLFQLSVGGSFVVLRAAGATAAFGAIALFALNCYINTLPSIQYVAEKHASSVAHHQHSR